MQDVAPTVILNGPKAARGIVFDGSGMLIGAGYEAIYRSGSDSFEVFVPGIQGFGQIDLLPDGDFVMADGESVIRIRANGSQERITSGYGDYGLKVGPDGLVYTGNRDGVGRIDPATGERTLAVRVSGGAGVLDFSSDLTRMYIGTEEAMVWQVRLDSNYGAAEEPRQFIDLSQGKGCPEGDGSVGCWHDGLAVDICGNVYVAAYVSSALLRVSPDGSNVVTLSDTSSEPEMFGHGIVWGSGQNGFKSDAIYQPIPGRDGLFPVAEVDVGVPPIEPGREPC